MTDLAGWFAAQLDADEAKAVDIHEAYCNAVSQVDWGSRVYDARDCDCGVPAFVLADITAKRRILAEHAQAPATAYLRAKPDATGCRVCHLEEGYVEPYGWCQTVRLLAAPSASRPGYDPSWAPEQPAHNTAGDAT